MTDSQRLIIELGLSDCWEPLVLRMRELLKLVATEIGIRVLADIRGVKFGTARRVMYDPGVRSGYLPQLRDLLGWDTDRMMEEAERCRANERTSKPVL